MAEGKAQAPAVAVAVEPGQYIRVHMAGTEARRIGPGWRELLVVAVGRKWVTLLYVPTVAVWKAKPEALAGHRRIAVWGRGKLLGHLRRIAAYRKREGLGVAGDQTIKAALALLGGNPAAARGDNPDQ